jgi:hypothetical protein
MAKAAEVFARRQKSREAKEYAHAVYVDALACEGEFLAAEPMNKGGNPKLQPLTHADKVLGLRALLW